MKKLISLIIAGGITLYFTATAIAATLQGYQGGTGFSTSTAGNDGYCLSEASSSPFLTWTIAPCGSSQWTTTSTGIYYNGGFVGINTTIPAANLEVNGAALFDATTTLPSGIWRGDGKVAIGTTNPHGLPLYVAGGGIGIDNTQAYDMTDASGTVRTTFGMTNQNVLFLKNNANGTGGPLQIYSGATSTQGITISLAGNVGIGTNSPNNLFHVVASVASTSDMGILFQNIDNNVGDTATLYLGTRNSQGTTAGDRLVSSALRTTRMTAGGSNDLSFLTSSGTVLTENMRLTAAGNLGIGTSTPASKLDVNGTTTIRNGVNLPFLAASSFLATDANNNLITTTTPSGSSGITSINGATSTTQFFVAGGGISVNTGNPTTTITNTGVTSITTSSPIQASGSTGNVTLSCPTCLTSIGATTSSVTFHIENPNVNEIDAMWDGFAAATIGGCQSSNYKGASDTVSWNLFIATSTQLQSATSTMQKVFTAYNTTNNTSTLFTPNGSTTIALGSTLLWVSGGVASSSGYSVTCKLSL